MPRYYEAHRSHLTLISAASVHGKRGTKFHGKDPELDLPNRKISVILVRDYCRRLLQIILRSINFFFLNLYIKDYWKISIFYLRSNNCQKSIKFFEFEEEKI